MLFNSTIGIYCLIKQLSEAISKTTTVQTSVQATKNKVFMGVAVVIMYIWWITNYWILTNLLVVGLLFLTVKTILINSNKGIVILFAVWLIFDLVYKYILHTGVFGDNYIEYITLYQRHHRQMPIALIAPFWKSNPTY